MQEKESRDSRQLDVNSEQAREDGGGWRRRAALQRSAGGRILRGASGRGHGLRVRSSRNSGMGGDAL
uniref:Uncharacterized protein n=1 Tax=Oryza rufipogon TaxID=4529 RepID=A0A679BBX8_ORYRU|nr:hypothetical protein [Oryza rufipogon]